MSACMSDVDLATLHKSRLDQRIKYQLSAGWVNRRNVPPVTASSNKNESVINNLKPTASANVETNHKASSSTPSTIDDRCNDCCDCVCNRQVACCGGQCAACQRSTTANTTSGGGVTAMPSTEATAKESHNVPSSDKGSSVAKRVNCKKHAVISCRNKKIEVDKESYLTRRRSGTWP